MKISFFLIFHLWVLASFAQQYLFGDFQRRYQLEKAIFLNDENHGLSKPILLDSSLENSIQEGIWSYGNFILTIKKLKFKKIFQPPLLLR